MSRLVATTVNIILGWSFYAFATGQGLADTVAWTAPSGLSFATFAPGGADCCNLGMVFTPTANITVDALGLYDIAGQIPVSGDTIALYNSTGGLLAQTVVTPSDTVVNGYFYQSISNIMLSAGSTYTVDDYGTSGEWGYGNSPTTSTDVTYDSHDYSFATTLTFPTGTSGAAGSAYYGGDFFFVPTTSAIPEPSSYLFLGLAIAGIMVKRHFSRSA